MGSTFLTDFLQPGQAAQLADEHGTPLFVYSRVVLERQAQAMLSLEVSAPTRLTVRYAMKANPHPDVLKTFLAQGLHLDASSGYEAAAAIALGYPGDKILLTSQQLAHNLEKLIGQGVQFNATSLHQLEAYGQMFPGTRVSVRLNPGIGSGHSAKTNVGGPTSSFGIWHEYIPQVHELARKHKLTIGRVHTHIGSGADAAVWQQAATASLELAKQFPTATAINLGGGFKVARLETEQATDVVAVGQAMGEALKSFCQDTGRQLHLELEPGAFLVANAGIVLASVEDIVDTGAEGYRFIKLNTGMNDILRPSLYGAQHPIAVLNDAADRQAYVVVGHNCESGDLLTPAPGQPEVLQPRELAAAAIGDLVLIGGCGAYCASMAAHGYNSYPVTPQIMV